MPGFRPKGFWGVRDYAKKTTAVMHGLSDHPKSMKIEAAICVGEGRGSVEPK
jgi:hypothetical protein